jgi:hypothetical protein
VESWCGFDLHFLYGQGCILAIWISFLEKVLFSSVAHFFIGSLILGEFTDFGGVVILLEEVINH